MAPSTGLGVTLSVNPAHAGLLTDRAPAFWVGESLPAPTGWKSVTFARENPVSQASGWGSPDQVSSDVSDDSVLGNMWPRLSFRTLKRPISTPGPPPE